MKSYYSREIWWSLIKELTTQLNLDSSQSLLIFKDTFQAFVEVLWGLGRQYPTRSKVALIKSPSPYFHPLQKVLYSLGYEVEIFAEESFKTLDEKSNFIETDWLAIVWAKDIPFLGINICKQDSFSFLNSSRIPQVILHHEVHLIKGLSTIANPFQIHLYDFIGHGCLLIKGDRLVFETPISENIDWTSFDVKPISNQLGSIKEDKTLIQLFESQFKNNILHINNQLDRFYDRALISIKDLSAWSVIELLSLKDNKMLDIETPSLIKWGGLKGMNWLVTEKVILTDLRSLFVIPISILKDPNFNSKFLNAIEQVKKMQQV